MAAYRVFLLNRGMLVPEKRRILDAPIIIDCETDSAAIQVAKERGRNHALEIWDRGRFVAFVTSTGRTVLGQVHLDGSTGRLSNA